MSPLTATRIMRAIDVHKEPDNNCTCIRAMSYSIAAAIIGSRNVCSSLRIRLLQRRLLKRASFQELFNAYHKVLRMLPLEDIASIAAIMEQLSITISKDHE